MWAPSALLRRLPRGLPPWLLLLSMGCGSDSVPTAPPPPGPDEPATPRRVLFIGNSLTGTNDLPGVVTALARSTGIDSFEAGQVVIDGYSLEDHLALGSAAAAISTRRWERVIVQDRSTAEGAALRRGVQAFAALADSAGSEIALLGVWPPRSLVVQLDQTIALHEQVAGEAGAMLIPAGAAWRAAWRMDSLIELYGPDESAHPSIQGTYLAALVVYGRLFDRSPVGLPSQFRYGLQNAFRVNIPASVAEVLQNAAAAVLGSPSNAVRDD